MRKEGRSRRRAEATSPDAEQQQGACCGRPKQSRGDAVVRAVLDATLDELARVGVAALSIEVVAELASVNKTTIYRRFPTKTDLIVTALARQHDEHEMPNSGELREDMIQLLLLIVSFMGEPRGRSLFRMLLVERAQPEVALVAERMHRESEHKPLQIFLRAIARGELAPECDVKMLLQMLFSIAIHRVLLENADFSRDEAERFVDMMLHGAYRHSAMAAAGTARRRGRRASTRGIAGKPGA